jgi:hypothetical protein
MLKVRGNGNRKRKIQRSCEEFFSDIIFGPDDVRFLTVALQHGTKLQPQSFACLNCGTVWSQTDPNALRDFIRKHCKRPKVGKAEA